MRKQKDGDKAQLDAMVIRRCQIAEEALEKINNIMWNSYMIITRSFGEEEGHKIMTILNDWCEKESAA